MKKLLLISNSTNSGEEYLSWPRPYIKDFLEKYKVKKVLFVPYAGVTISWDQYTARVRSVFNSLGFEVESIHESPTPIRSVLIAEAIVIGGGNTFHLVHYLHKNGLMEVIAESVREGLPFMGWSAGSNVACPTLRTTNDMPVIQPEDFSCLSLVPFQINPHYLDAHPAGHGGETREDRIREFLEINKEIFVAGLREGTLFEITDNRMQLLGSRPCRVFKYGMETTEYEPGAPMDFLLNG